MPVVPESPRNGIDAMAFADLLREPLAASRALLELLAGAECPDPGMIGGYLRPALRELGRACELLEDLHVLDDAEHAVGQTDEAGSIDVQLLVETAGLETFRRGEMLPPPDVDARAEDGSPLVVHGHRRTLDRMVRTAIELAAETAMSDACDPLPLEVQTRQDPELGSIVQLSFGRLDDEPVAPETAAPPAPPDEDDGLGDGPTDDRDDGLHREAHRFRRLVLEAIARAQGGRAVFDAAARPAAIRIELPRARPAIVEEPREQAA